MSPRHDDGSLRILVLDGADEAPSNRDALARCRAIRRVVFVDEQQVPEALEWDGLDAEAQHFLALFEAAAGSIALGTARMRIVDGQAKAERVAVLRDERSRGVGRRLMRALEDCARRRRLRSVILHAQVTAIPFYERLGYVAHGDVFLDAGIDHRAMTKALD